MAKANADWNVLPHEPIEKLAENLWFVRGSLPNIPLKRTMVVARHADGRLVIHNGIALEPSAQAELEAWGTPTTLVVPGALHRLDAPAYKKRYPALRVLAPRGARKAVEKVIAVDGTYEDADRDDAIRFEMLHGMGDQEGTMLVRSADGVTVVFNDAVFNMDRPKQLLGKVITGVLGSAPGPRISRLVKLVLIKDTKALRADLERYAALPELIRVIVAHDTVTSGPAARDALLAAAAYL